MLTEPAEINTGKKEIDRTDYYECYVNHIWHESRKNTLVTKPNTDSQCWFNFKLPPNAFWYAGGRGCIWECDQGFEKDEQKNLCVELSERKKKEQLEILKSLEEQNGMSGQWIYK